MAVYNKQALKKHSLYVQVQRVSCTKSPAAGGRYLEYTRRRDRSTADFILTSPLMHTAHETRLPDYPVYTKRKIK